MNKKLKEAIRAEINEMLNEAPLSFMDPVSNFFGGIKGTAQNAVGNFRVNKVKNQLSRVADRIDSDWNKAEKTLDGTINNLVASKNPSVKATGKSIQQQIAAASNNVETAVNHLRTAFPSSVGQVLNPNSDEDNTKFNLVQPSQNNKQNGQRAPMQKGNKFAMRRNVMNKAAQRTSPAPAPSSAPNAPKPNPAMHDASGQLTLGKALSGASSAPQDDNHKPFPLTTPRRPPEQAAPSPPARQRVADRVNKKASTPEVKPQTPQPVPDTKPRVSARMKKKEQAPETPDLKAQPEVQKKPRISARRKNKESSVAAESVKLSLKDFLR